MIFGTLIGSKIFKSLSPAIWKDLGVNYKLLEFNPKKIKEAEIFLFKNFDFFNITSPYKKKINNDNLQAKDVFASNLVVCPQSTKSFHNTDILALNRLFKEYNLYKSKKILVLGAGVMAQQILNLIFNNSKAKIYIHNRTRKKINKINTFNAQIIEKVNSFIDYDFVINTTPVEYKEKNVLSLSYNKYVGGLNFAKKMLVYQAVYALDILIKKNIFSNIDLLNNKNQRSLNLKILEKNILNKISKPFSKIKRIWLVGFMGVGKTVEGKKLAKHLALKFIDTDALIEKENNLKIKDIFKTYGEAFFRQKEGKILNQLSEIDEEKLVIATGGGAINHFDKLKLNGEDFVVWLQKDFEKIEKMSLMNKEEIRPLWDNKNIDYRKKLFNKRESLYLKYADMVLLDSYKLTELFGDLI